MAVLTTARRKQLRAKVFGLPSQRRYPMEDPAHAANAKARATQQVAAGNLSPAQQSQIDRKADSILRK